MSAEHDAPRVPVAAATHRRRVGILALVAVAVVIAARQADASSAPARCSNGSLRVIVEPTQGTAAQAVAFLSVANAGGACRLLATGSLTVMRNGSRVASIRGNPVSYRIEQTINRGTTMLFDAWWANWCATRTGDFAVRGVLGALSASGPYHVLPECIGAGKPSRLHGVRAPVPGSVFKVTPPVFAKATRTELRRAQVVQEPSRAAACPHAVATNAREPPWLRCSHR